MEQVELSFVVPAFNEEDFIEETLGTLDSIIQGKHLPYEIVVVDDGSRDGTLLNAKRYAKRNGHVKVVSYHRNFGKGYAVKTGFMQASGGIVIFADSDLEIDLTTISQYINALNRADIVIASKSHPDSHAAVSISRRILSFGFNRLVQLLTGVPFKDTQSGLKAMKKNAFVNIFPRLAVKRYAFDVELLSVANLYGLRVKEMPVNIKLDASFRPRQMWLMFLDLLGIAYRLRVLHWYQRQLPKKDGLQTLFSYVFREQ
jgi:glycosyltransferase involved in cell wall biosynthesis